MRVYTFIETKHPIWLELGEERWIDLEPLSSFLPARWGSTRPEVVLVHISQVEPDQVNRVVDFGALVLGFHGGVRAEKLSEAWKRMLACHASGKRFLYFETVADTVRFVRLARRYGVSSAAQIWNDGQCALPDVFSILCQSYFSLHQSELQGRAFDLYKKLELDERPSLARRNTPCHLNAAWWACAFPMSTEQARSSLQTLLDVVGVSCNSLFRVVDTVKSGRETDLESLCLAFSDLILSPPWFLQNKPLLFSEVQHKLLDLVRNTRPPGDQLTAEHWQWLQQTWTTVSKALAAALEQIQQASAIGLLLQKEAFLPPCFSEPSYSWCLDLVAELCRLRTSKICMRILNLAGEMDSILADPSRSSSVLPIEEALYAAVGELT